MTDNDSVVRMPAITALPDINLEPLHQLAVVRVREFIANVLEDMPDYDMTDKDLTSDEIAKRQRYADDIIDQLNHCTKNDKSLMLPIYLSSLGTAMSGLRRLLKGAYERKAEKVKKEKTQADETAKQQAVNRKVDAALKGVNPPVNEAKRLLGAFEYQCFEASILKAIDAYIDAQESGKQPGTWLQDVRSWDYRGWCSSIKKRQDEQQRRQEAARQAKIAENIMTSLRTAAVHKLRVELANHIRPILPYPATLSEHHPNTWCELHLPDDKQVEEWVKGEIRKRLPITLADVVRWGLDREMKILPHASYEVNRGIPCLKWDFTALILVTANLELGDCQILEEHPEYALRVRGEGQKVGTIYIRVNWVCDGNFTTPIILLQALAAGKMEAPGITVVNLTGPTTTFLIAGADNMRICDDFREFIKHLGKKKMPLWQSLFKMGIIDAQVADLLKQKWSQCLSPASQGSALGKVDMDAVVDKLVLMGWTEKDATTAVKKKDFPPEASIEAILKSILESESE